ncbi:DgyrCDS8081 [Dimorphilus gyrociliatus]|uniref:DgyrCDS8081 n=1 Tax=Dimorphilus gyrociliatus TaxID=2664684 RepID=A0A7I8VVD7_9ANNE|nr:DgyrCDS8081 [Dimorphilus gyrociliatus]
MSSEIHLMKKKKGRRRSISLNMFNKTGYSIDSNRKILSFEKGKESKFLREQRLKKVQDKRTPIQKTNEKITDRRLKPKLRWIRAGRIVRMLVGVCIAIRKYAFEAGLLDNYLVNVSHRHKLTSASNGVADEELKFNEADYKIKKEFTVPEDLKPLFERKPEKRSPEDIEAIRNVLIRMSSFRKYTTEMQKLFCKIVRYERCQKRRVVLRKGHIGYNLYFIFSGAVNIVIDKDDASAFVRKETVTLKSGACFGEIALVKDTRRNATCVCAKDTEFIVVDKDDFKEAGLHIRLQEETEQRFDFFRKWSALGALTDDKIWQMSYVSRVEEFNHNKVLVADSRQNEWLWFITKGSCDLLHIVSLDKCGKFKNVVRKYQATDWKSPTPDGVRNSKFLNQVSGAVAMGSQLRERYENSKTQLDKRKKNSQRIQDNAGPKRKNGTYQATLLSNAGTSQLQLLDMDRGLFFKIDTLRDGECFGIDQLFPETNRTLSLISKGCEVIHIMKSTFVEMIQGHADILEERIKPTLKEYPSDEELLDQYFKNTDWECYKEELMEKTVYDIETKLPYELGLRSRIRNRTSGASSAMSQVNYDALDGSQWKDVVEFDQTLKPKNLFTKTEKSKSPVIPYSSLFFHSSRISSQSAKPRKRRIQLNIQRPSTAMGCLQNTQEETEKKHVNFANINEKDDKNYKNRTVPKATTITASKAVYKLG